MLCGSSKALLAATALCLMGAGQALAAETAPASDSPVATARGAPAPPTDAATQTQIQTFLNDGHSDADTQPLPDHRPHRARWP